MKNKITVLAGLALASAALAAQVDPTKPMVTGHGNVTVKPDKVVVTHQTATTAAAPAATTTDDTVSLGKFVVTGSLIKDINVVEKPKG